MKNGAVVVQDLFDNNVQEYWSGPWKVQYQYFCKPGLEHLPPMMILGGAFQKFQSFKKDVRILMEDFPVILVDLPGQGGNDQLSGSMTFDHMADILVDFMDGLKIEKVTPIAVSYGSAIGYSLARNHPKRLHKLILGGTTPAIRETVKLLLDESIRALRKGKMEDFASGVVLNLMNYSRRREIKGGEIIAKRLHENIKNLSENEKVRYIHNTQRLMNSTIIQEAGDVETLVMVGEFDNFTTPFECFSVSKMFKRNTFAIVKGTDHLASYERKDAVNRAFLSFAKGENINQIEGVKVWDREEYPDELRQLDPRLILEEHGFLDAENGLVIPIIIRDINSHGFKLECSFHDADVFEQKSWNLKIPKLDIEYQVLLFDHEGTEFRGIFKKCCLESNEKMEKVVKTLERQEILQSAA